MERRGVLPSDGSAARWLVVLLALLVCAPLSTQAEEPQVWNAGRGGNRTSELLSRVKQEVEPKRPELVVVLVGTNDLLNSKKAVSLEVYRENLLKLITRLQQLPSKVLMMTIPPCYPPDLFRRHQEGFYGPGGPNARVRAGNVVIHEIAAARGVPVVDLYSHFENEGRIGEEAASYLRNFANSRSHDGVHPTVAGYRAMAGLIAEAIVTHRLPSSRIICFGDSITFGSGMEGAGTVEGDSYPAQLRQLLMQGRGGGKSQ